MMCSSLVFHSRAELMTPSCLVSLHPLANFGLLRLSASSPISTRCCQVYGTLLLRPTLSRHVTNVAKVDWAAPYAKDESAFIHIHAAALSTNEPTKVQRSHVKRTTTYLGAFKLSEIVPPHLFDKGLPMGIAASIGTAAAVVVMLLLAFWAKSTESKGSVSDLVKRGQLRFDRKADSTPLKYDDPFNNPMVKGGKKNPLVRMCGKIFKLAPVTLTEEKVARHQNRRLQAYQWKRPVVFLNEGESIPDGVDPEEVRWIPSNHPFATTANYIDEDLAQQNVYQTRGVPTRIKAEHEALRSKIMEAAQKDSEIWSPPSDMNADVRESSASDDCSESSTQSRESRGREGPETMNESEVGKENLTGTRNSSDSYLRSIDGSEQERSLGHSEKVLKGSTTAGAMEF